VISDDPNFNTNGNLNGNWNQLEVVRLRPALAAAEKFGSTHPSNGTDLIKENAAQPSWSGVSLAGMN